MRRDLLAAVGGLSSVLLTAAAFAAQAPTSADFVKTVAISDMFEVQSGQLASEKAQIGDVKSFGKKMMDDHAETRDDVKELIDDEDTKSSFQLSSTMSTRRI
jgi:predicted outer membrane protein